MSDIHLNSNVFKVFERVSADKQITAKEAAELKEAIKADGKVDGSETALLDKINSKLGASYELTVSSDNKKMTFDPTVMAFDQETQVSLQKLEDEGNFTKYNEQFPELLAHAEKQTDLNAINAAYSGLASTLDTYRRLGVPGVNASLRKLADSMARIEKRDQLFSPVQKALWLQMKYSVAPPESMAQLKKLLLSPQIQDPATLRQALDFVGERIPPKNNLTFLKEFAAAHPAERDEVRNRLSQLSNHQDKAVAQAARQALKDLDAPAAAQAPGRTDGATQAKGLFGQKPLPIDAIARAIADPAQRTQTLSQLMSYLENASEVDKLRIPLELSKAVPGNSSEILQLKSDINKMYSAQGNKPAEIVRVALWRASKSLDPQYQARTLEEIGRAYPADSRIKVGINNLLEKPDLTPSDKVALERALLSVDAEAGFKALSRHLAPPAQNLSLADQKAALKSIFASTRDNPALAGKFTPLMKELIQKGPAELLPELADGLQSQKWPDRELFTLLLKNSRNQETVRLHAINGLGNLAVQGDQAALQALADYYPKTASLNEQNQIRLLLTSVSKGQSATAAQAGKLLAALPQARTAQAQDARTPGIQKNLDAAIKDYQAKFKDYYQIPTDTISVAHHLATKSKPDVPAFFTPANKENLLRHGSAKQKAEFINLLRATDSDKARGLILEILKSTRSRAELDDVEEAVRGKQAARPDYAFSKTQQAEYAHHQKNLRQFDYNLIDTTRAVLKMNPAEKGKYLGYAVSDYTRGLLNKAEAKVALSYILQSIGSSKDYDAVLSAMHDQFPALTEANLVEILGQDDFAKLKGAVGVVPAKLEYDSEKEFVNIANKFFDELSQLEGDDYLSTNNLVKNNPKIKEQLFFKYFLDPAHYQNASPSEKDQLLNNRMKLAKLISEGRVKVGTVPQYFADKYLFGKRQLGLFELSGDFHLKDFVGGSIRDKARQYVAIDEFAGKIYDVTKAKFSEMQTKLLSQANDPELDQKLKHKAELLKPYAAALTPPTPNDKRNPLAKLQAQIAAENSKLNPKLSKEDMALKAEIILATFKLLQEYGTDGPKAAVKMKEQAAKLAQTAKDLGITSGSYQQDRLEFRKKAYALYHDSSMDLLNAAYKEALSTMSPDAQAVVKNADDLEEEIDTAKKGVVIAGKIVGGMVGLGLLIDLTEFGVKLAQHYDKSDSVDKVRRSPEAHAREMDAILLDAVITAGIQGFDHLKDVRADKAARAVEENFAKQGAKEAEKQAEKVAKEHLEKKVRDEVKDAVKDHVVIDPAKEKVVEHSTGHSD